MVAATQAGAQKVEANSGMDSKNSSGAPSAENSGNVVAMDEANATMLQQTADNALVASDTRKAIPVDVQQLKIKVLEQQLELERSKQRSDGERKQGAKSKLRRHAEELRALLAPMPESDELVLAWFRSTENMLKNRAILDNARGPIIVQFPN